MFCIYSPPFLLCFYILICYAKINTWYETDDYGQTFENMHAERDELMEYTLSPLELMIIRNSTALQYWRRDFEASEKRVTFNETNKNKDKQKVERSQVNSNDSTNTSPIMRAQNRMHKEKRELNFRPKFRQVTSDYRSTRITPMAEDKLQEAIDEEAGMHEMMSAFNMAEEVRSIVAQFSTINMTIETIGRTVEYKDIILVRTTETNEAKIRRGKFRATNEDKFIDEKPEKKIVFIVHGLSVMGMQFLPCLRRKSHFKKLLSFYFQHLDKFDIYFIPMANPDGYARVMNSASLKWNKNYSPQPACNGVALDRNFDVAWNSTKVVSSCSQQYPGESPFSEAETRSVRDIFHRYGQKIVAYINVHSGTYDSSTFKGDAVLYPKGYSESTTDDDKYIDLRGEIEETIKNCSFEEIEVYVDTLHNWYGKVSGTSVDYAATVYGVPFSMEFVMQLYSANGPNSQEKEDRTSDAALDEIWGKVIDTVFKNIWKSFQHVNEL